MASKKSIEELFRASFAEEQMAPPSSLRESLFDALDEKNVENIYRDTFKDDEIIPQPAVWSRISRALWLTGFLSFSYNQVNVYYVATVIGVAGLFAGMSFDDNEKIVPKDIVPAVTSNPIISNEVFVSDQVEVLPAVAQSLVEPVATAPSQRRINSTKKTASTRDTGHLGQGSKEVADSDYTVYSIDGDDHVCVGGQSVYSVVPADVDYTLVAEGAKVVGNTVFFEKAGVFTVSVRDAEGNSIAKKQVNVSVKEAPEILGDRQLCQDENNQTLRVKSSKDIGIQYNWDFSRNAHTVLGNGYVAVVAKYAGVEDVVLTQIDKNTGCVSTRTITIDVKPKPVSNFSIVEHGNLLVEVKHKRDGSSASLWNLDGQPVELDRNLYQFDESGVYRLKHILRDSNGCKDSSIVDVVVNNYSLFVPNAFVPGTNVGRFNPSGNGLKSYRIEIFDVNNQKLWESTALDGGQPSDGWDGYHLGVLQPAGKYYYKIQAVFANGAEWKGVEMNGSYSKTGTFYLVNEQ